MNSIDTINTVAGLEDTIPSGLGRARSRIWGGMTGLAGKELSSIKRGPYLSPTHHGRPGESWEIRREYMGVSRSFWTCSRTRNLAEMPQNARYSQCAAVQEVAHY